MTLSLPSTLEAVLFAHGEPMGKKQLADVLGIPADMLAAGLRELARTLESRGLALVETDTQVELRTHADATAVLKKLRESELSRDLGKASLETLAIILYQNGATRSDIDWVRGVNSTAALRSLLMRGLIERGEDVTDRRRARYTPTVDALAHLGIGSKEELPRYAELAGALAKERVVQGAVKAETEPEPPAEIEGASQSGTAIPMYDAGYVAPGADGTGTETT
ncbi:MAG: segregation and condensation protein [Candidatus Parcubacteria bacterium]|jgi:segregation and condensation protein B|nr:segregation and condensation protein [Candidatus Parcubacteria bacterium]